VAADWLRDDCGVTRLPSTYDSGVIVPRRPP
jgi:hypothetical protein